MINKGKRLVFSSRKRTIITGFGILLILFLGWRIFGQAKAQTQYQTAQVTRGSIISSVTESGNVTTNTQGSVGSPTTGIIEEVYVKNGDTVIVGQNLFKVKSTATAQEIASAYANLLTEQNNLNSVKAKINSLQQALFVANQTFVNDKGTANPDTSDPKYIEENVPIQATHHRLTHQ